MVFGWSWGRFEALWGRNYTKNKEQIDISTGIDENSPKPYLSKFGQKNEMLTKCS